MKHNIQILISLEAESRQEACRRLANFIDNPHNPNFLPSDAKFNYYFTNDQYICKDNGIEKESSVQIVPRSYCSISHCQEKLVDNSLEFCELHLEEEAYHIYLEGYGWAYSISCDGKKPVRLCTKAKAEKIMAQDHGHKSVEELAKYSVRRYVPS